MKLLTIPPSHFSEKARWALDRAGLAYREERHPPLFHRLATWRHGGKNTVPVLLTSRGVLADSTSILKYADEHLPEAMRLYPPDLAAEVLDYEMLLGQEVGWGVIRFAYFHILPETRTALQLLTQGVPAWEKWLFPLAFPLVRWVMQRGLKLEPAKIAKVLQRLNSRMDEAASRLQGRRYLFGDRFTAADLTLSALLAPLFLQPGFGGALIPESRIPAGMLEQFRQWQSHPIYDFVGRNYREHRRAP